MNCMHILLWVFLWWLSKQNSRRAFKWRFQTLYRCCCWRHSPGLLIPRLWRLADFMVTVNVLRFLCILSSDSLTESKLLTSMRLCSLATYFKGGGRVSLSGAWKCWADAARDSHPISNSWPCLQLIGFCGEPERLNKWCRMSRCRKGPLHILHRIAWSEKLSQSLRFKPDHLSNCPIQFIVEENTATLSHLDLLQGDVEDIVVGRRGMMPFVLIPLLKLKATYAIETIKGDHPSPSTTPYQQLRSYYLDWFSVNFIRPNQGIHGNLLPLEMHDILALCRYQPMLGIFSM